MRARGLETRREKNRHSHYQSDREYEASHDLDETRIIGVQPWGAALDDLGEQATEGQQDPGDELAKQ